MPLVRNSHALAGDALKGHSSSPDRIGGYREELARPA